MSAIAGILRLDGAPVQPARIEALTAAMQARGPDGSSHWLEGSLALGHCMLRATPESRHERQPLLSEDGALVLVWDGRLDNREDLRRELRTLGQVPRDDSDAELVLHAYQAWQEQCPPRLEGDFAFAVRDARRHGIFLACDRMGGRALAYVRDAARFAFASREEALLALGDVSARPNEELLAYQLVPDYTSFEPGRGWLGDIRVLGAAEAAWAGEGGEWRKWKYWSMQPGEALRFAGLAECQEAFAEVFGQALRRRLRVEGEASLMLSGGLDSAAILAMSRRQRAPLRSYSVISDHPENCIETRCILSMTRGMGEAARSLSLPSFAGMASLRDLIDIAWTRVHPVENDILLPQLMCLGASRAGSRVMLAGFSGDIALHAPNHYPAYLLRSGRLLAAWRECRAAADHHTYLRGRSLANLLLASLWSAFVPEAVKRLRRAWRGHDPAAVLHASLIRPEFAARLNLAERLREQAAGSGVAGEFAFQRDYLRQAFGVHGIPSGMAGFGRAGGHVGMEVRDPWADRQVVEFFARLPLEYKVRDGWTKYLVRSSFAAELDDLVRWRLGKEHLGADITAILMDASAEQIAQAMENELQVLEEYVDIAVVRQRYREYVSSPDRPHRRLIYEMAVLLKWLRRMSALAAGGRG